MSAQYHINPRIRAYGKARIDITRRASDEEEWQSKWRPPLHPYPFTPGEGWRFCFEYKVDDFAAEVGFFIDILGFDVLAFSPSYAQFADPNNDFCFSIVAAEEGEPSTDPDTIRLQFKVEHIHETVKTLEARGIVFEQKPVSPDGQANLLVGYFRSPHGVCIDLFSEISLDNDDDYPREEDEDEVEADKLIEEILGLSDDSADEMDTEQELPEEENENEDGYEELSDEDAMQEITFPLVDHQRLSKPQRRKIEPDWISQLKTNSSRRTRRSINNPSNRFLYPTSSTQSKDAPARNGKPIPELTYQEIEEDSALDDEN